MIRKKSPFKLTTHFRGWSRVLGVGVLVSISLNFLLAYANLKQSRNFSTPRIVMKAPSGIILPVAASAFVWTPEVARDYVKTFLPVLYTFSPLGVPQKETWTPFINVQLLQLALEKFQNNRTRIESDGLHQTLLVREVQYDEVSESAQVVAELRIMGKTGDLARTPLNLTVELTTTADPLNPYGHTITNVH
jgi:hypothetical protein